MSDWTRIRNRLKKKQTEYEKSSKKNYSFTVSFGHVKMWFSSKDESLTAIQIFDLFENSEGNMIRGFKSK